MSERNEIKPKCMLEWKKKQRKWKYKELRKFSMKIRCQRKIEDKIQENIEEKMQ